MDFLWFKVPLDKLHGQLQNCQTQTMVYESSNRANLKKLVFPVHHLTVSLIVKDVFIFVVLFFLPPLKKNCFLSSGWPKLWPVGQPQSFFSFFFFFLFGGGGGG